MPVGGDSQSGVALPGQIFAEPQAVSPTSNNLQNKPPSKNVSAPTRESRMPFHKTWGAIARRKEMTGVSHFRGLRGSMAI